MGEKRRKLPRGVTIKKNRASESLQVAFTYKGVRCREVLKIEPTTRNIKYADNLLGEIQNAIERKTFQYADYFPNSAKLRIFGRQVDRTKTVLDYMEEFQESARKRGLSPSTLEGYRKLKKSLSTLHDIPVSELTPALLKDYVRKSGNSPKTLRNKFSYMRTALAEAITDGLVDINPIDTIKLSNYVEKDNKVNLDGDHDDIDPFTPEEVSAIIKKAKDWEVNVIKFVFNTGMRPSEWSALRWEDIDFINKVVVVKVAIVHHQMKGTKTNAGKRAIPLNDEAMQALNDQKALSFIAGDFVFPQKIGMPVQLPNGEMNRINPDSFRKHKWSRILKSAGVRYRYPYQMRHTFATRHISQGVNLWQLANWMGHASPEMLFRHYGRFIEEYEKTNQKDTKMTRTIIN